MHLSAILFGVFCFAVAQPADSRDSVTLDGCSINLKDQSYVPAQEQGVIAKIYVVEGLEVAVDQPLVQIDDSIPQQQVKVAQAEFNAAKVTAENHVPRDYAKASKDVAYGELNVSIEANRRVPGSVPGVNIEKLKLECKQMELSIEKAEMDTKVAEKQMDVKKAQLDASLESLRHRLILSPLSEGKNTFIVRDIKKHVGEWVQNGETVVHLVQMNILRTEGLLDASKYAPSEIKGRQVTVEVKLARGRIENFKGQVVFTDPMIRPDGHYVVRAEVENRKENGEWLLQPGLPAKMTIHLNR